MKAGRGNDDNRTLGGSNDVDKAELGSSAANCAADSSCQVHRTRRRAGGRTRGRWCIGDQPECRAGRRYVVDLVLFLGLGLDNGVVGDELYELDDVNND